MASRFQACSLVGSPMYQNAIAWSEENLIAVASGHLVTILNPALPFGPRGLIVIPNSKPFPFGVIERKDLLSQDGRVKVYRQPYCEICAEWVEVMDISDMMYNFLAKVNFGELDIPSSGFTDGLATEISLEHSSAESLPKSVARKGHKRETDGESGGRQSLEPGSSEHTNTGPASHTERSIIAFTEVAAFSCSNVKEGSSVEVLKLDRAVRVWVSGILESLEGAKARVLFPETDENGKQAEWIEINSGNDSIGKSTNFQTNFPKLRPSMNVGRFPEEILCANCDRVGEVLKIGQPVEAWTNDRWVEGLLMGFDMNGLSVKLPGEIGPLTLDASSVRFAPSWIHEQNLWQIKIVRIAIKDKDPEVVKITSKKPKEDKRHDIVPMPKSKAKALKKLPVNRSLPVIAADQYVSRSAILSSLVVAWSPILQASSETDPAALNNSSGHYSLLAVGAKSGKISFWRICEPQGYSVEDSRVPVTSMLAGCLQAHYAWVTAISWQLLSVDGLHPQVLLVTGSSDGSVKIWMGNTGELMNSSETNNAIFHLLKEVINGDSTPISVLSSIVPVQSLHKMLLAVGKGSGSFEVWICDMSTRKFDKLGLYAAHDHVVTGLAWAFDGCCLYSCSQDNTVRSWILRETSLFEVPIPSNTFGVNSSTDLPNVSDSCFGVAVSSGNLVLAVARSFDVELLNQMYQARTQKAAVEFFWIGGQELDTSSNICPELNIEASPGFSEKDLFHWETNILSSLKQYECLDKPLVLWDIITALSAFKRSIPKYVERVLVGWLRVLYMGSHSGSSTEEILLHVSRNLHKVASRQLHLFNILCRCVVLSELKADQINCEHQNLGESSDAEQEQLTLWIELILSSERELRERLLSFSFSVVLGPMSGSATNFCGLGQWYRVGLAQMERWIALNYDHVRDQLKLLASEVRKLDDRLHSICDNVAVEQCSYCSAPVPFESPESALCQGSNSSDRVSQNHKLLRCAVSMQVCPATPVWFCACCQRRASKLAPLALFQMPKHPSDFKSSTKFSTVGVLSKPLCPFCGILQQRLQPVFLLSPSPV